MKAVVWRGIGNIKLEEVEDPKIQAATDAVIRITTSSICGTDLHMIRGTLAGMKPGTILGHEAVGMVESIGDAVTKFKVGDRVVVCSTLACGHCVFCQAGEFASCDNANPVGPEAGSAFFGGPALTGPYNGLQAERARIPFADTVLIALPDNITNEDAILCSDIFPTGYMGADIASVKSGDLVAVFGCGPVGQMTIASAFLLGAKKVFAIDVLEDRLAMAEKQGAIAINYEKQDPVKTLKELTNGFGPDCCIDVVGVDAQAPHEGPAKPKIVENVLNAIDQKVVAPVNVMFGDQWRQGDAPSQVITWCTLAVRKSGVISIIGVYPPTARFFPIGVAMQKALTIRAANCSHAKYIPKCLQAVSEGKFYPSRILTETEPMDDVIAAYKHFDKREPGWMKIKLLPNL